MDPAASRAARRRGVRAGSRSIRVPRRALSRTGRSTVCRPPPSPSVAARSISPSHPANSLCPEARFIAWLERSATAASTYFGKFPVPSARILIVPTSGRGAQGSQAFGFRGAAIRLQLGRDTTEADLRDDWVAVHEMTHLALPDIREPYLWLAEGIATYVEPIARVQAGQLTAEQIWSDMVRDMWKGLPRQGDQGLDRTPTWGRTYWGGAMFCLLADIDIRKQTGNRMGLQQALRAICRPRRHHRAGLADRAHLRGRRQGDRHHGAGRSLRQDGRPALCARSRGTMARSRDLRERRQGDVRR